eukprot:727028-Hanusia_phi.AAC.1
MGRGRYDSGTGQLMIFNPNRNSANAAAVPGYRTLPARPHPNPLYYQIRGNPLPYGPGPSGRESLVPAAGRQTVPRRGGLRLSTSRVRAAGPSHRGTQSGQPRVWSE